MSEKVELITQTPKSPYSAYQKAEYSTSPDDKSWSLFGGSGINLKLTDNLSVDGFFAGKTANNDKNGYQTDFTVNYDWGKLDTDVTGITFGSQARLRYQNCGSENFQLRTTPAKISFSNKTGFIPVDELYSYPVYATCVHDLKSDEDKVKFGSLVGLSKKINDNSSLYFEVQADTKDTKLSDNTLSYTLGYKHTF